MRGPTLFKAVAVAGAATILTSACFGQGSSTPTSTSASSGSSGSSASGASGDSGDSKTVEIMVSFTGAQLDNFKASVDPYAKAQGIRITWSPYDNVNQLIVTRMQGKNAPDIAIFPQLGIMKDLAGKGKLAALDDVLDMATLETSMTAGTLDAGTLNGKLYGLLVSMNVESLVFYPKKAFEAAGYAVPKSLPELLTLTDKIRASGRTPWCLGIESSTATGWPATDWFEDLVLKYGGISQYNDWVSHKVKFNSPLVRQAADTFQKIAFTDGNVLGGRKSIASNNFATAGNPMFKTPPRCFMYKQGNSIATKGFFPDNVIADIDNQVGVFGFPPATPGGDNPVLGGGDLAGLFSKDSDAAKTIMKYLSTKEFGVDNAKTGGFMSPHKDFDISAYPTKTIKDIAKVAYDATAFGFDGSDAMPGVVGSGSFWREMTAWISGATSLDNALKAIDASWPSS